MIILGPKTGAHSRTAPIFDKCPQIVPPPLPPPKKTDHLLKRLNQALWRNVTIARVKAVDQKIEIMSERKVRSYSIGVAQLKSCSFAF